MQRSPRRHSPLYGVLRGARPRCRAAPRVRSGGDDGVVVESRDGGARRSGACAQRACKHPCAWARAWRGGKPQGRGGESHERGRGRPRFIVSSISRHLHFLNSHHHQIITSTSPDHHVDITSSSRRHHPSITPASRHRQVNRVSEGAATPLIVASSRGRAHCVRLLLAEKADAQVEE